MFCRNICCFICTFLAVATATIYSGQVSSTESSTSRPVQEVRPTTAMDLGALLDAGEGTVVALVAGDTRLAAHRAVLSARSPVFQRILQDAATGEVAIPDVEGPVLRQLLAYLYTLQAPQLPAMAPQLLAAADQYGLPALKADCEQQVAKQLSVETAAATAVLAVRYSCDSLRKASIDYIRTRIFHVMGTQGWKDAINTQPQVMIKVMELLSQSPVETRSPFLQKRLSVCSTPASAASSTTPTIEPHSVHSSRGQTAASAASPKTSVSSASPGSTNICFLCLSAPGESGSSVYHITQAHSDYSGHQIPTTAAPNSVAKTTVQTDDDHVTLLRSLSPEEKTRRLMEAAEQGAVGELEALLAAGAYVGAKDGNMLTALHWAAYKGHEEAARRLLAAGAAVDDRNRGGWTPLHYAASGGHAAVVRLLLDNGADHGARDMMENTPLHWAAEGGHREAVAALLEAGAGRRARDYSWNTPLDMARDNNHHQVVELLRRIRPTASSGRK